MKRLFVLLLVANSILFGEELEGFSKVKSLEMQLEARISQDLNLYISKPKNVSVTIATQKERIKQEDINTRQSPKYLPGLYDLQVDNLRFDEESQAYVIDKERIKSIDVLIEIDSSATKTEMQKAKEIALKRARIDESRGDSVRVIKRDFVNQAPQSASPAVSSQALQALKKSLLLEIATRESNVTKRLDTLQEAVNTRINQLNSSDINKLTSMNKEDLARLESLATDEKKRFDSFKKVLYKEIVSLREHVKKEKIALQKIIDEKTKENKQYKNSHYRSFIALRNSVQNTQEELEKFTQFTTKELERMALKIERLAVAPQKEANRTQEVMPQNSVHIAANLNEQKVEQAIVKNSRYIDKIKADNQHAIAVLEKEFRMWILMLLIAFLSVAYIIYYFASSANERLRNEIQDLLGRY